MSSQVELVLTLPRSLGPEMAYLARARTTLGALTQMVAQTQYELVMAAPYIGGSIFGEGTLHHALHHAVERRNVELTIFTTGESIESFKHVPWIAANRSKVRLFHPAANAEAEHFLGSHAKFCIADRLTAYVGSANLTYLGLHKHLEMGVLLQGEIVRQISDFWKLLVESGFYAEDVLSNP